MEVVKELLSVFKPIIELLVLTVGPVLVGAVSAKLIQTLNIQDAAKKTELDANLRDALHKSAENAIKFALARLGLSTAIVSSGVVNPAVIREAINYVVEKNPDALKGLEVSDDSLTDILMTKAVKLNDVVKVAKTVSD